MAYAVKYRLLFSDDESNKKKLEIEKDGYVGAITDIIGTNDPVQITYQQNEDDPYYPIISSNARINLYVTDAISYDDLLTEDERLFKVTLYYFDDDYNDYVKYWQGFLIPDAYQEVIGQTPYLFSVSATDNLGVLDGIVHTMGVFEDTLENIIEHCLDKADLGLGYIYDVGLSCSTTVSPTYNDALNQTLVNTDAYFEDSKMPMTCQKTLISILSQYNLRVYQRRGYYAGVTLYPNKWVIQSNAKPLDTTYQTALVMPTDVKPLNNSLIRFTKGALKTCTHINSCETQINPIRNGAFENGSTSLTDGIWTLSSGFIGSYSSKGLYAHYFSETVSAGSYTLQAYQDSLLPYIAQDTVFNFKFDFNFNNSSFPTSYAEYGIHYVIRARLGTSSNYYYYDEPNDTWQTSLTYNQVVYKGRGEWKTYSKEITTPSQLADGTYLGNPNYLRVEIYRPYLNSGGTHFYTYLDGVAIELVNRTAELNVSNLSSYEYRYKKQFHTNIATAGNITRKKEYSEIFQNNIDDDYIAGKLIDLASGSDKNVPQYIRDATDTIRYIDDLATLQRLNDGRNGLIYYEGTIKKISNEKPICVGDYITINFTSYSVTEKLIIDTLEYNVKSNSYKFTGHLQSQATDTSATTYITYQ